MDKKISALLGAAAAVTALTSAQATPVQQPQLAPPTSYGDLLSPVPNALALLRADDAAHAQTPARVQLAQFYHHHHHHHHHHHGFFGGRIIIAPPVYVAPAGECYWAPGRPVWNGYRWVRRRVRVCD